MIDSIWQNKGIANVALVFSGQTFILRVFCRDKLLGVYFVFLSIGFLVLGYRIKETIRLKTINNFIYSNPESIYIKYEDFDVSKVQIYNMIQYKISYTLKREQPYKLSDKFEIGAKREKEFELCLRYQNELEFVFRKDNPSYNFVIKSDAIKEFDTLETKTGWYSDKRAFWYVVFDVIYATYIMISML